MNLYNFQLKNSIPEALRDPQVLQKFLKKFKILPYYGTNDETSHNVLKVIADLCELSPSHNSCKKDLKSWAFGNELDIQKKVFPGLYIKDADLSDEEKIKFAQSLLDKGINLFNLLEHIKMLFSHLMDSGNAYLYIKKITIGKQVRYVMEPIHFTQCAYLADDTSKIVTTKYWDENYWKIEPPKVYPVSKVGEPFNFKASKNGTTEETILHLYSNRDNSYYYGRPNILACLRSLVSEYNLLDLQATISGTEFVTKTILAFEEVDPNRSKNTDKAKGDQFAKKMNALRAITTQEGAEAKSLVGLEYPFKGQPPQRIDLTINRDTEYNRWLNELNVSNIYGINGWSRELSGQSFVRSNVGSSILRDQFLTKNLSTIKPIQIYFENVLADIFYNTGISTERTIKFRDLIQELADLTADAIPQPNQYSKRQQKVEDADPIAAVGGK